MESWVPYALLSAIFAALVAIFGKIGLGHIDATLATALRAIVMAAVVVTAALAFGKARLIPSLDDRALAFIVLSGVAGALSWLFYFIALQRGTAHGVAALDRLSVVFVLILAALFLGEGITWKTGVGAALVALGAILMSMP